MKKPIVLVQDYHFALLPRLIKEKRPDARVAIFWHIPWPNPESFGICPWQRQLVDGLLGADSSDSTFNRTATIFYRPWTGSLNHASIGSILLCCGRITALSCVPSPSVWSLPTTNAGGSNSMLAATRSARR